jgi:HAD superfamily hydrolase (TIGR01509 family)
MKRAVVFDLDGTLIDSLPLVLNSIAHALEPFGARPTMEIFAKLGGPPDRFLPTLLDDPRHVPTAMVRMTTYHRENLHLVQPFAGALEMLAALRARGMQLAIWTGRDRESGTEILGDLELADYFSTIVFGDDLPTHKPDPQGLREIMTRLGVNAAETLFVGDADVDVLGGAGCSVDTILIEHTRAIAPAVRAQAWRCVPTPAEAFALLARDLPQQPK